MPGVGRLGAGELGVGAAQVGAGILPLPHPPAGGDPLHPRPFQEGVGIGGVEPQRIVERGGGLGEGGLRVLPLGEQGLGEAPPGVAQVVARQVVIRLQLGRPLIAPGGAVEGLPRIVAAGDQVLGEGQVSVAEIVVDRRQAGVERRRVLQRRHSLADRLAGIGPLSDLDLGHHLPGVAQADERRHRAGVEGARLLVGVDRCPQRLPGVGAADLLLLDQHEQGGAEVGVRGGHLGLELDRPAGGLDPLADVLPRIGPVLLLPLRQDPVGDGEVVVGLDVAGVERDGALRQAEAGREVGRGIGPALGFLLAQAPEDVRLENQPRGQPGIDPQGAVAGGEVLLHPLLGHVRQRHGRLHPVPAARAVLGVEIGVARPRERQAAVDLAGTVREPEGLLVTAGPHGLGRLQLIDLGFELSRPRRVGYAVGRHPGVGIAPFIERDEPGQIGGAEEPLAQISDGGLAVGPLGLLAAGLPLAGGSAVGVGEGLLVGPSIGEAQRLGHL
ncbi:MAG: hypothetical protein DMF53_28245, partial [Acidobacteria bacterium]